MKPSCENILVIKMYKPKENYLNTTAQTIVIFVRKIFILEITSAWFEFSVVLLLFKSKQVQHTTETWNWVTSLSKTLYPNFGEWTFAGRSKYKN